VTGRSAMVATALGLAAAAVAGAAAHQVGDTLTVIMRPISSVPALLPRGESFSIHCLADPATQGWEASLVKWGLHIPLTVTDPSYHSSLERWVMRATIPPDAALETYDLFVRASGIEADTARNAVRVLEAFPDSFYIVHVTDTHLPTTLYWYESGADTDSSCIEDYRAVIEDLNVINPVFAVHTGDVVNEGELEDHLDRRYYSRAKRLMGELTVPQYVVAGNHDVGGWNATPPPDGAARRAWWRFFGWPYLDDPPPGDDLRTQNYSFDFGDVHFAGMEAYINYDGWRYGTYGSMSFTQGQMVWLQQDLEQAQTSAWKTLFYHYDFQGQLDADALDVDLYLWGHIHADSEIQTGDVWSIATERICGGHRAYRIVRFTPDGITPSPTLSAGTSGQSLWASYAPANDGTAAEVTATVYNSHNQRFENGLLRFFMAPQGAPYGAEGGELLQAVTTANAQGDSIVLCHVGVDILPRSAATVIVRSSTLCPGYPAGYALPAVVLWPNPLKPGTQLYVRWDGAVRPSISIFDVRGRAIREGLPLRSSGSLFGVWPQEAFCVPGAGLFLLRFEDQGRVSWSRLVVVP
jgi:hypothetical protein